MACATTQHCSMPTPGEDRRIGTTQGDHAKKLRATGRPPYSLTRRSPTSPPSRALLCLCSSSLSLACLCTLTLWRLCTCAERALPHGRSPDLEFVSGLEGLRPILVVGGRAPCLTFLADCVSESVDGCAKRVLPCGRGPGQPSSSCSHVVVPLDRRHDNA